MSDIAVRSAGEAVTKGYIWTNHITPRADKAKASEIWERFPKFILGFVAVFAVSLWLALGTTPEIAKVLFKRPLAS